MTRHRLIIKIDETEQVIDDSFTSQSDADIAGRLLGLEYRTEAYEGEDWAGPFAMLKAMADARDATKH